MRNSFPREGWVEVICGSMFSGKSEELLRRLRRAEIAGQKVLVVKPALDARHPGAKVQSHDGRSWDAHSVQRADEILLLPGVEEKRVVAIDEAQFLDQDLAEVVQFLADRGKRVIVSGLDMDFRGYPFGPLPNIMCIAEYVDKLQAICSVCGQPAFRTQRLVEGKPAAEHDPLIKLGAGESYEARCRGCHEVRHVNNLSMLDG